jgi:hypothetical protein
MRSPNLKDSSSNHCKRVARQALQPASRRAARSVTSGKFATMKFRDAKDLALANEREKQTPKLERQTEALS